MEIPQIWTMWTVEIKQKIDSEKILKNAPNEVSLASFFWKIVIGLITWGIISALLFAILSVVWTMFSSTENTSNTILWPLLAFIWFIAGMLGNMGLALFYNLFFSKRYYSLRKMLGLIFASSFIIFLVCIPLYFLPIGWGMTMTMLFTILGFQILFSCYLTANLLEYLAQPNYCASSLLWTTLGFMISIVAFMFFVSWIQSQDATNQIFLFMLVPTIIWYTVIIAGNGIWDAVYYKLFQWGNNPFYLKSSSELSQEAQMEIEKEAENKEEINVDVIG